MRRVGPLAVGLLLISRPAVAQEKQVRPFVGLTFAGSTNHVLGDAVGKAHLVLGINAAVVGNIVGIEGDVSWIPGFFEPHPDRLVLSSGVTTATGGVIVTLPRRLTEYTLRPYVVAGAGVMRVGVDDLFGVFKVSKAMAAYDVGGGAVGFFSDVVGVAWDVRKFGTLKETDWGIGVTRDGRPGRLGFWRASMALVVRY